MRTHRLIAAAIAGAAAAALTATGAGSAQTPPATTFTIAQRDDRSDLVDAPPLGGEERPPTTGDAYVVSNVLLDPTTHRHRGRSHAICQVTVPGRHAVALCTQSLALDDGTLTFVGPYAITEPTAAFAVVGGTGRYTGARGTVTYHSHATGPSTFAVTLLP